MFFGVSLEVNGFSNNWFKFEFLCLSLTPWLVPAAVFKQLLWILGVFQRHRLALDSFCLPIDIVPHFYSHAAC